MTTHIYPRFLGMDGSGDFVWELESGRWTWGDDPHAAITKQRTFEPVEYIGKYGRPIGIAEDIDRKAEADEDPAELVKFYQEPPVRDEIPVTNRKAGAVAALRTMLEEVAGWIETAQSNHQGMDHRGENRGEECWRSWAPADIRSMINDAARRLGVAEFPVPAERPEDKELER